MTTQDNNVQDNLSRQVYLNYARPFPRDLVPELAALPKKERSAIETQADKRLHRTAHYWRFIAPHLLILVPICLSSFPLMIKGAITANMAPQLMALETSIQNLERSYNALAQDNPDYPPMHLDTAAMETVSGYLVWVWSHPLVPGLLMLVMLSIFAYYWGGFVASHENRMRLPYVRELLAERKQTDQPQG